MELEVSMERCNLVDSRANKSDSLGGCNVM